MSWNLRQYFVCTEHLIKEHFVPLFPGLTMADSLSTLTRKLLTVTEGQGLPDYSKICYANHLDYEKWNNHQRGAANGPIFKVMSQFLGFKTLISRTHEFFEQSLVYYKERPDLMRVVGEGLECTTNARVAWNGQDGGFEGLRQKGWSVCDSLKLERAARHRNVEIDILTQGDNQIVFTRFKVPTFRTQEELQEALDQTARINTQVMIPRVNH